jgi:Flagellar protein FlaF.
MPAPTQIYKETAKIVANPREVEANLLFQSASRLQAIADHWDGKAAELRDALLYNRTLDDLWRRSRDAAPGGHPAQCHHLGLYVLRRTLLILADPRPASLAVLIGINRNLASGLLSLPESAH